MNTEYIKNLDIWKFFIYLVNTVITLMPLWYEPMKIIMWFFQV